MQVIDVESFVFTTKSGRIQVQIQLVPSETLADASAIQMAADFDEVHVAVVNFARTLKQTSAKVVKAMSRSFE